MLSFVYLKLYTFSGFTTRMLSRFKVSVSVLVFSRLVNDSSEVWHWSGTGWWLILQLENLLVCAIVMSRIS